MSFVDSFLHFGRAHLDRPGRDGRDMANRQIVEEKMTALACSTVAGFVTETDIYCRPCGEALRISPEYASSAAMMQDFHDEYGAECSACGIQVVAPDLEWTTSEAS